jgi:hypothetical protein
VKQESQEKPFPYRRVNYFHGQLLTAEDFRDEQTYFREKHRALNRYLYDWGIVCGLKVSLHRDGVRVEPGLAFDCQGNEIVVPEIVDMPLPESEASQYIVIEYTEKPCSYVAASGTPSDDTQPTRIEESYSISYMIDDPCRDHHGFGSLCGFCEEAHAIPLARLRHRGAHWSVRRYSCIRHRWWVRLLAILPGRKKCSRPA